MFKCPFCQSENCKELSDYSPNVINQSPYSRKTGSYNDDLSEFQCYDCGMVSKVNYSIYNKKEEEYE